MEIGRRTALKAIAALAAAPLCRPSHAAEVRLMTEVSRQQIAPPEYPATSVWCYNGTVPGRELRFRQGETARIAVTNRLPVATTVHWHGLRVPNAMDGVPDVTQPPIRPGEDFIYEFPLQDAGTYWYHPHLASYEQVARGLYGVVIVEERDPITVDRDVVWVLSDFRLNRDASQREDFDSLFDLTHGGRIGNTVTVNGRFTLKGGEYSVRSGERIRLRLVNTAAARIFVLRFEGHEPRVIALDGHAVEPHVPESGRIVLAPGMRADLVLDCLQAPGSRHAVTDHASPRGELHLMTIAYTDSQPLRSRAPSTSVSLRPNPLPEPDAARAQRHSIVFEGGAMGSLREAEYEGERIPLPALVRQHHLAWTINGMAVKEHVHEPMLTLDRGSHHVLAMRNETAWPHPIHLHGHVFRVIARDGRPTRHREWADTVLMAPREAVDIAFVADNPGDWMFHCHILTHQAGGMMALIRVV
ncbi:MAG TPA: multicopper oxidase family protein [Burkholderiales bacterium]|nr:multicopper oxidase family protein [Burkholderiales bacterium]